MRATRLNIVTLRDNPADAEVASHRLLLRAGFIYKSGSGLYLYGPLLQRVIQKIRSIVCEEINSTGAMEITMPILQEADLWQKSGRWDGYLKSKTMLTVNDRHGQEFGLAPTAEEVVTDYVGHIVNSHKQLPVCYYQQHTKFRDEIRPRFGLMRVKEFIMMDAYSFHASDESLDETYHEMRAAYHRIFERCGLKAFAVEADSGSIGGSGSHEFMIDAESGEDTIIFQRESGYAANSERAQGKIPAISAWSGSTDREKISTPNVGSIDDVVKFLSSEKNLNIDATRMLKAVLFIAETAEKDITVAAFVRGDRDINEIKVSNCIGRLANDEILQLRAMNDAEVQAATTAKPGFAGPGAGLAVDFALVDEQIQGVGSLVVGANEDDAHILGFDLERDSQVKLHWEEIVQIRGGDEAPDGSGIMDERRGIEAGHIFKLGTKYSAAMKSEFTNQENKLQPFIMGCYGIGTSRVAAAAVEQYHDDNGMQWPMAIAPYHIVIVPAGKTDEHQEVAEKLYQQCVEAGMEAILDDRKLGPGVKFKDWDLIGIPLRIVVGRGLAEGKLECKDRRAGDAIEQSSEEAFAWAEKLAKESGVI